MKNPVLDAIHSRRSVREFTDEPVDAALVREVITAGIWAPSGKNNQPWRFAVITDQEMRSALARLTIYERVARAAPVLIAVFLDTEAMYDEVKDHQAAGACVQNMLLAAHALGLGGVWLGQILANKAQVNELLGLSGRHDLMAVVALGHPVPRQRTSSRKPIDDFLLSGGEK